jgi:phage shock protein PspC (stress-responsive transcriptional regulator)/uncharacterized membrane protein
MKESKKVSISGVGFVFDVDAYEVLAGYLDNLNQTYKDTADGEEIVADIEARIAELILSRQSNMAVVSLPLIRSIIDQMGSPEAIEEESNEGEPKAKEPTPRIPRRLYRNPESAKLGGVCSGIGTFFDIDPVWVRLAMFAPIAGIVLFQSFDWDTLRDFCGSIFGIFILGYFVMWFAIPMAKSARQKLEMTGEKINAQTISSKTRAQAEMNDAVSNDERGQSLLADIFYVIGRIVLFFFKAAALLTLTAILAGVIACNVGLFAFLFTAPDNDYEMFHSFMTYIGSATVITLVASAIVGVVLPLALLAYLLSGFVFGHKINRTFSFLVGGAWIVALVIFFATAFSNHEQIRKGIKEAEMREAVERNLRRWNVNDNFLHTIDLNDVTVKVYNHTYNVDPDGENVIEIDHDQLYISIPEKDLKIDIDNRVKESPTLEESADEVIKAAGAVIESAGRAIVKGSEAEVEAAAADLAKAVIDVTKAGLDSAAVVLNEASKAVNEAHEETVKK